MKKPLSDCNMKPISAISRLLSAGAAKKLLFIGIILGSVLTVSCTKRVEGILREEPTEISKTEAEKLLDYYNGQFAHAQALLKGNRTDELRTYFKSPDWVKAEACRTKLTQLPPELTTELKIAQMELSFIDFVNEVIKKGIPLREVEE